MTQLIHHGSDLFNYDQKTFADQILLEGEQVSTKVEYDEYVVYAPRTSRDPEQEEHNASHITHRFSNDKDSGAAMLNLAFRKGYRVDQNGAFRPPDKNEDPVGDLQGRVRRVICFRRQPPFVGCPDQLSLTSGDLADLGLHPATLQYATRIATESRFWSRDRSTLNLILSFSETPKTPCDFLSMTYNVLTRSTTILIRQSWEPRRHRLDDLDEYDDRLESCRDHWAHPLVMPVILLQVQFTRCEEAVADNTLDVVALEGEVSSNLGFGSADSGYDAPRKRFTNEDNGSTTETWGPMNMTNLMKKAHDVLKGTIKLLDTIRWVERAVKLLMLTGDELAERLDGAPVTRMSRDLNMGGTVFGSFEREPSPLPALSVPVQDRAPRSLSALLSLADELGVHWYDIRQCLEALLRLSMSLETERRMAEARCRAQIDIIYSRMAQEDNALNARMAVTSSRDSASMKALAVITAIFLPGEFIGTLFGMSMFDWLAPAEDDGGGGGGTSTRGRDDHAGENILSGNFWVYWIICIPLTLFILASWRVWWVTQDRYFRRHLSHELSEERFWTTDGKPRKLEDSFIHDFFYLSSRRDERPTDLSRSGSEKTIAASGNSHEWGFPLARSQTRASAIRQRQTTLDLGQGGLQRKAPVIGMPTT